MIEIAVKWAFEAIGGFNKILDVGIPDVLACVRLARAADVLEAATRPANKAKDILFRRFATDTYPQMDGKRMPLLNKKGEPVYSPSIPLDRREEYDAELERLDAEILKLDIEPIRVYIEDLAGVKPRVIYQLRPFIEIVEGEKEDKKRK